MEMGDIIIVSFFFFFKAVFKKVIFLTKYTLRVKSSFLEH